MNYQWIAAAFCVGLSAVGQVEAQTTCPAGTTRVQQVQQLVGGSTVCASRGAESWQEFHSGVAGGPLIDYKRGANDPVDPTEQVGTWSAQNGANSSLTHNYGSGGSYTWLVCQQGAASSYTLVSTGTAGTISGVTLRSGQVSCGAAAAARVQ